MNTLTSVVSVKHRRPFLVPVKKPNDESEENFDVGDAIGGILDGAFGIFHHTVKTAAEVAKNMVSGYAFKESTFTASI